MRAALFSSSRTPFRLILKNHVQCPSGHCILRPSKPSSMPNAHRPGVRCSSPSSDHLLRRAQGQLDGIDVRGMSESYVRRLIQSRLDVILSVYSKSHIGMDELYTSWNSRNCSPARLPGTSFERDSHDDSIPLTALTSILHYRFSRTSR